MQSRREVHERWMRRALEVARTAGAGVAAGEAPNPRPGSPARQAERDETRDEKAGAPQAHRSDSPAEPRQDLSESGPDLRSAPRLDLPSEPRPDLPVGAIVIGPDGRELAAAANAREALGDPTAHAEVLALRQAAAVHGDGWRLEECTLVVTLEPCTMCAGAAVLARVGEIVFGAWEPKTGAVGSLWDVVRDPRLNHNPDVYGGVLEAESAAMLRAYFGR